MASEPTPTSVPEGAEFRTCPNCYHPMPARGDYCAHCGQRYTDGRITVGELIRQFFSDILNFDAKIWRTLAALLVPGKLTEAFFQGRQQAYVRPLRLFFVTALIAIAAVSFFEAEFTEDFFVNVDNDFSRELHYQEFLLKMDSTANYVRDSVLTDERGVLDSLQDRMREIAPDSLQIGIRLNWGAEDDDIEAFNIAKLDLVHLTMDSIHQLYGIEKFSEKLLLRQNIRLREKGHDIGNYIINKTVWMMLLLMPIMALFFKLFYVRRSVYYVEHLIFSFHTHAFIFLLLSTLLLIEHLTVGHDSAAAVFTWGFVIGEVYFFAALKRFYGQSYGKTFLKFLLLNLVYAVTFFTALIVTIVISALVF